MADLDEPLEDNYVKKHIHDDVDWLVEQGEDPLLATKKARLRIFGDPPQAYGTGVGALIEGKNWQSVEDIAQVYSKWSSFHIPTQGYSSGYEAIPTSINDHGCDH